MRTDWIMVNIDDVCNHNSRNGGCGVICRVKDGECVCASAGAIETRFFYIQLNNRSPFLSKDQYNQVAIFDLAFYVDHVKEFHSLVHLVWGRPCLLKLSQQKAGANFINISISSIAS
ncbi:uncharacterized protein LOC124687489 [Lolium rigidum]|uniref:uncharacterized protein LOC124687489 n=1 Tax=Lolium rigidum TaxID=89674 RepID=UPI001F5D1577|nr:uncharacterized protein LOC124687489 [Lolium rigidum]